MTDWYGLHNAVPLCSSGDAQAGLSHGLGVWGTSEKTCSPGSASLLKQKMLLASLARSLREVWTKTDREETFWLGAFVPSLAVLSDSLCQLGVAWLTADW